MKIQNGFTLLETEKEFKEWLDKQHPTRTINKLQVHHTYAPAYSNWKTDIDLRRIRNTVDFHKKTFGSSDIAQHYTIFPNGKIATGRDINSTPIGIKGWNTGAICCEIYGNFDVDTMTKEQKEAVIAFYGIWCKKLKLKATTEYIRPHCWFTSSGTYLGDYNISKSEKSMKVNFLPLIQSYIDGNKNAITQNTPIPTKTFTEEVYRVITNSLNVRKGAGTKYEIVDTIKKGNAYTIVEKKNGFGKLKSGAGWISLGEKYVELKK